MFVKWFVLQSPPRTRDVVVMITPDKCCTTVTTKTRHWPKTLLRVTMGPERSETSDSQLCIQMETCIWEDMSRGEDPPRGSSPRPSCESPELHRKRRTASTSNWRRERTWIALHLPTNVQLHYCCMSILEGKNWKCDEILDWNPLHVADIFVCIWRHVYFLIIKWSFFL